MGNYLKNNYNKYSILTKYAVNIPPSVPKISVIIPVYNVEKYLDDCLLSLILQTLRDIEIICVNDGSTDGSIEILKEFAERDSRFVIIEQENQGTGCARNNAIKIAKGEYLAFVDPDDWIEPKTLETLYNQAKSNNAQIVQFNYIEYNDYSGNTKKVSFAKKAKKKWNYNLIKKGFYHWRDLKKECLSELDMHAWTHFYNAQFIKNNNIEFAPSRRGEDHLFTNGAKLLADKVYYLDEAFYYYRCRKGSAENSKNADNLCIFDNIKRLKNFIVQHNLWDELECEFLIYQRNVLGWHYNQTPEELIPEYEIKCHELLNDNDYQKMLETANGKKRISELIFSVKNKRENGVKSKIITILGLKITLTPKNKKRGVNA